MRCDLRRWLAACLLAFVVAAPWAWAQAPEALRIFVPVFSGDRTVSPALSRTLYFEMIRAFADPGRAERGAWILYGVDHLPELSHRSAVEEGTWPSTRADLIFWGSVTDVGGAYMVEPRLSRTPLSQRRTPQPDQLNAVFTVGGERIDLSLANSATYFDLEPFMLPASVVEAKDAFARGLPIYASPDASVPVNHAHGVVWFISIEDHAAQVRYGGNRTGWLRFPRIEDQDLRMIDFGRGLIQLLRGDYPNAAEQFALLAKADDIPNALRVDANIYLGIARQKLGDSGAPYFAEAWTLNPLDADAVRFHLLSMLLTGRRNGGLNTEAFAAALDRSRVVFGKDDPWLHGAERVAAALSTR